MYVKHWVGVNVGFVPVEIADCVNAVTPYGNNAAIRSNMNPTTMNVGFTDECFCAGLRGMTHVLRTTRSIEAVKEMMPDATNPH